MIKRKKISSFTKRLQICPVLLSLVVVVGCKDSINTEAAIAAFQEGIEYYRNQDLERAMGRFEKAIEHDPGAKQARMMIGRIYYYERDFAMAELQFADLYNDQSCYLDALFWQGKAVSMQSGRADDAKQILMEVLEKNETHIEARYLLGWLEERKGNHAEAIAMYRLAIDQSHSLLPAYRRMAKLYEDAQMPDRARVYATQAEVIQRGDSASLPAIAATPDATELEIDEPE